MNIRIECREHIGFAVEVPQEVGNERIVDLYGEDEVTITLVHPTQGETDYRVIASPVGAFLAVKQKRPAR